MKNTIKILASFLLSLIIMIINTGFCVRATNNFSGNTAISKSGHLADSRKIERSAIVHEEWGNKSRDKIFVEITFDSIYFDEDEYGITSKSKDKLKRVLNSTADFRNTFTLLLNGYSEINENKILAMKRMEAVKEYLIENGFDNGNIIFSGGRKDTNPHAEIIEGQLHNEKRVEIKAYTTKITKSF